MNHEHQYAEQHPHARADSADSLPDSEADSSSAKGGRMHQEPSCATVWDNWKSVRDVD